MPTDDPNIEKSDALINDDLELEGSDASLWSIVHQLPADIDRFTDRCIVILLNLTVAPYSKYSHQISTLPSGNVKGLQDR